MIGILLLVGVATLIYYLVVKPIYYWSDKNVRTGRVIPLFGDNFWILQGKESFPEMVRRIYNKLEDVRYVGGYQFQTPILLLKSPDLIKQMCVKDFDYFLNHRTLIPDGVDELWSKNLVALKGQTWKNMRSTLSPSFTSSKMKAMFVLISHNANLFVEHYLKNKEKLIELDFKDAYTRYSNDVIASAAFGIQVDSLGERENEFYTMGRDASNFNGPWRKFVFFIYQIFPATAKFFKLRLFNSKMKAFFMNLVRDTIKLREEQNIKRPDMLGLLLEARKGNHKEHSTDEIKEASFAVVEEHLELKNMKQELTDADIASQVFIFFLAGLETVSTAMCFIAYELAVNPDVQQKLFDEIIENRPENGSPSYETIANMTYLDMVISEALRKWPPAVATDRVVTRPYTIKPERPDEKPVDLEIDSIIWVPIVALHYDPKYYENPEKFDPERFSPENRSTINPYTYLPFGVGPRNCIGSRFALLETKAVFFHLLSHFEIVPTEKTQIPLVISRSSVSITAEKGFHFGLKKRN